MLLVSAASYIVRIVQIQVEHMMRASFFSEQLSISTLSGFAAFPCVKLNAVLSAEAKDSISGESSGLALIPAQLLGRESTWGVEGFFIDL